MKNIIPVMHCFNNNYVLPASVAFYSMIKNSNRDYEYKLYVIHSDITNENIEKLTQTVNLFKNATIEFIDLKEEFIDLFEKTKSKGHYSKEMYYKFLAPSLFPQYEKIMIADVDVVYLNDISNNFDSLNIEDDYYSAGTQVFFPRNNNMAENAKIAYNKEFSEEERAFLKYAGGYYIFNLKKMREDNIEKKLIKFAKENFHRLLQPEQDCINLIFKEKFKKLPLNSLICTYQYELYKDNMAFVETPEYKKEEILFALNHPIQLHYASTQKPWNDLSSPKADIWFKYITETPFLNDYLINLQSRILKEKLLFSIKLPFSKRKLLIKRECHS